MPPLSNAERQKRFRERIKAAARGENLAEQASTAISEALEVVWRVGNTGDNGDFDAFETLADYKACIAKPEKRASWQSAPTEQLIQLFSEWLDNVEGEERSKLERALSLLHAVSLRDDAR